VAAEAPDEDALLTTFAAEDRALDATLFADDTALDATFMIFLSALYDTGGRRTEMMLMRSENI
jgi:hypothetical protein